MKKIILTLLALIPLLVFSQLTTYNPDSVCYQTSGSIYEIPSLGAGYTYAWTIASPGIIINGQGTDSINVDWSTASPGLIPNAVSVIATNTTTGCQSEPVTLNVLIYQVTPTITPIGPFCPGSPCVTLVGTPLNGVWSGNGVTAGQFCPTLAPSGNHTITYTITSNGCTFFTTSLVTINTTPVLLPISHD
jgi:hypothetical protein